MTAAKSQPTFGRRESQRNQQHIPEKERRRAFTGREPGLPLHGVQPAPETEEHREFERRGGIAEPTGRRLRRNRGTQRKTRSGARKPRAAEPEARAKPAILAPQRAKTEQKQHQPDGREDILQAAHLQRNRAGALPQSTRRSARWPGVTPATTVSGGAERFSASSVSKACSFRSRLSIQLTSQHSAQPLFQAVEPPLDGALRRSKLRCNLARRL